MRSRLSRSMSSPSRSERSNSARSSASPTPGAGTSSSAEAPPDTSSSTRLPGGVAAANAQQGLARREAAFVRARMARLAGSACRRRLASAAGMAPSGATTSPRSSRAPERIRRALHHRGGRLADGERADRARVLAARRAPRARGGARRRPPARLRNRSSSSARRGCAVPAHRPARIGGRVPFDDQIARAVRPPGRSRSRCARMPSERSCSMRARNSRVTSPVTYSPEKQDVSNAVIRASSCRQARHEVLEVLVDEPVGADRGARRPPRCGRWRPAPRRRPCRCRRRSGTGSAARPRRGRPCSRPPRAPAR